MNFKAEEISAGLRILGALGYSVSPSRHFRPSLKRAFPLQGEQKALLREIAHERVRRRMENLE